MKRLRQIRIVGLLGLRSLHTRIRASLIIVTALAGVSVVLLSMLSMEEGMRVGYLASGHADRAIILSAGAERDWNSSVPQSWVDLIATAPGIRGGTVGTPLLDAETYTGVTLTKRANRAWGYSGVRGIGPQGLAISSEIRMVDGRYYRTGTREVIVGILARQKFSGVELGDKVKMIDDGEWVVVGHFSTGSFMEGDLIADPQMIMPALRKASYNSVLVSLAAPDSFDRLKGFLTSNPGLSVTVERESDYWLRQFQSLPVTPLVVAYVVAFLLAGGAVSGILHTMHATVSSRSKEIAILRAVGFGGLPVAVSMILEAMLFACIGAAIGTAIDWLWLDGYAYNGAYGVFRMLVTPHLLAVAIGWALVTALVGAIVPAAQEARLPVVDALGRL
jgi:putative ABC transport system permease protein